MDPTKGDEEMMRRMCCLTVPVLIFGLAGCGMLPDMQSLPEQVLAGDWVTTTETGEDAIVSFDEMGAILSVLVESSDGNSVVQNITGVSSVFDRDAVYLAILTMAGEAIFDGALSADLNQLIGSLDAPIVIDEDRALSIPAGDVRFDRLGVGQGMLLN